MRTALGILVGLTYCIVVFGNIFRKAGFSRWYSLAMALPILNFVAIIWLAFTDWPLEDKVLQMEFEMAQGANPKV